MKIEYLVAFISIIVAISSILVAYRLNIVIQQLRNEIAELNKSLLDIKKSLNKLKGGLRGIVYILPYNVCSSYWHDRYGDRIFFYVYENVSKYANFIEWDFGNICKYYNTVIILIPADNTSLYFYNLKYMSLISARYNLSIIWAIFPKRKFGNERDYLRNGTMLNKVIINIMDYLSTLNNTLKVAIWYGWLDEKNVSEILSFYDSLRPNLKKIYALWLDQPFVALLKKLPKHNLSFLVITELYDEKMIRKYSGIVPNQMIITGYSDAVSKEQWIMGICKKILLAKDVNDFGIWIYYDINDGSGERYAVFFKKDGLANPWICLSGLKS